MYGKDWLYLMNNMIVNVNGQILRTYVSVHVMVIDALYVFSWEPKWLTLQTVKLWWINFEKFAILIQMKYRQYFRKSFFISLDNVESYREME